MKQKPLKLNRSQRRRLSDVLKKVRFTKEETLECEHIIMSQLVEKTPWYQCENPKCRTIFYLRDVAGWKPSAFLNVLTEIVKAIKDKEEPKEKKK